MMPEDEKAILEQKIAAATARLAELRRANREMEINIVICQVVSGRRKNLDGLSLEFVCDLQKAVTRRRQETQKRIEELRAMDSSKPT